MSIYIVVVDDEPDVEEMFRQQFRRDLRSGRFSMEFALSAPAALERVKAIPDPSLVLNQPSGPPRGTSVPPWKFASGTTVAARSAGKDVQPLLHD